MRRSFAFLAAALLCASAAPTAFAADAAMARRSTTAVASPAIRPTPTGSAPSTAASSAAPPARSPDFNYSKAVKSSGVVWTEETIDKWLTNPQAFIPGQRMNFKVADPADRADLIAYLKSLKLP